MQTTYFFNSCLLSSKTFLSHWIIAHIGICLGAVLQDSFVFYSSPIKSTDAFPQCDEQTRRGNALLTWGPPAAQWLILTPLLADPWFIHPPSILPHVFSQPLGWGFHYNEKVIMQKKIIIFIISLHVQVFVRKNCYFHFEMFTICPKLMQEYGWS